jgi:glutathione S-transferase
MQLYEIFWSHFCEKARWCLAHKGVAFTRVPVNPITRREVKALGARGRVPVLADAGRVIGGSDAIAAYLDDAIHSGPRLVPAGGPARQDVLAIEKRCGEELGPDARRLAYHVALQNPVLMEGSLLFRRAPMRWGNRWILRVMEPRLRKVFTITDDEVALSGERLRSLIEELQVRLQGRDFLAGDELTLADITVAALLDPLEHVPAFVRDREFTPLFAWKRALAGRHHRPQRIPWMEGPPPPGLPFLDGAPLPRST